MRCPRCDRPVVVLESLLGGYARIRCPEHGTTTSVGTASVPDFDGETYERDRDHDRLAYQLGRVRRLMADQAWHSLREISRELGDPEASVSARLRDLRKAKFGGYTVERRYAGDGLWEYRMLEPQEVTA